MLNSTSTSATQKQYKRAITFGTFDLFHIGHVRILQRAHKLAEEVIVGISTDQLNWNKKKKRPVFTFKERAEIIASCKYVTDTFGEESLEAKRDYIKRYGADVLIMGDDWQGKFDFCLDLCDVVYLPRTECISTTQTIDSILQKAG